MGMKKEKAFGFLFYACKLTLPQTNNFLKHKNNAFLNVKEENI
jgi:hypothetical protein